MEQPQKEEIIALDYIGDKQKKWSCLGAACNDSCCFRFQQASIFIHEILPLSKYFPLTFNGVFNPGEKSDLTLSIFLRSSLDKTPCFYLREGEGCTLGDERPLACKQFPFCMEKNAEGKDDVALKPSCPGLSDQSGHPILTSDGAITPLILQECVEPAIAVTEAAGETQRFVDTLLEHDLISVATFDHRGEQVYMYIIDAQKLRSLPGETIDDLRAKGYMDLILAHINSVVHMRRFIDTYLDRKTGK